MCKKLVKAVLDRAMSRNGHCSGNGGGSPAGHCSWCKNQGDEKYV